MAVPHPLPEGVVLGQPPDPLHDDRGRRQRQGDVRIQDAGGALEAVLAGVPGERREDDLLDQASHLGVEHGARDEPAVDQDLSQPGASLLGDGVERPVQVGIGDPAAALEERADPLALPRGGRGAQLALLEEEVAGLVAVDQGERSLQALEEDPAEDLRQGRLGEGAPKPGRCGGIGHGRLIRAFLLKGSRKAVSTDRRDDRPAVRGVEEGQEPRRSRGGPPPAWDSAPRERGNTSVP